MGGLFMAASAKQPPPRPHPTLEVEATWLEPLRADTVAPRRALPPPLPSGPVEDPPPPPRAPPPLAASAGRHATMPVESQWLEITEMDARLRASLTPLPPTDVKTRARMSTPIPREDPDDEPAAKAPAATKPARAKTAGKPAAKKAAKAPRPKR
jgi:hypothetical protein